MLGRLCLRKQEMFSLCNSSTFNIASRESLEPLWSKVTANPAHPNREGIVWPSLAPRLWRHCLYALCHGDATVVLRPDGQLCERHWKRRGSLGKRKAHPESLSRDVLNSHRVCIAGVCNLKFVNFQSKSEVIREELDAMPDSMGLFVTTTFTICPTQVRCNWSIRADCIMYVRVGRR